MGVNASLITRWLRCFSTTSRGGEFTAEDTEVAQSPRMRTLRSLCVLCVSAVKKTSSANNCGFTVRLNRSLGTTRRCSLAPFWTHKKSSAKFERRAPVAQLHRASAS
jgi:hypothetical protein